MLYVIHLILTAAFIVAPPAALTASIYKRSRGPVRRVHRLHLRRVLTTLAAGAVIGCTVTTIYLAADGNNAKMPPGQVVSLSYFAAALIFVVSAFDALIVAALWRLSRAIRGPHRRGPRHWGAITLTAIARPVIMISIALPFVMACSLIYRPALTHRLNPRKQFDATFDVIDFHASDSTRLSGWWIPVERSASQSINAHASDTVVICHGLGSSKADSLRFAEPIHAAGYNVLQFDFRACGESDGRLSSLGGELEKRDVLAAVRWLRLNHLKEARQIFGFGVNTGAAALIEAATDPSNDGCAIDAVAVYQSFDSLDLLGRSLIAARFTRLLAGPFTRVGLSVGSAEVGTSLHAVAPADIVRNLWPRPILVIHAVDDAAVPFDRGRSLFDAADQPKRAAWLPVRQRGQAEHDVDAIFHAIDFFDDARSVPAV